MEKKLVVFLFYFMVGVDDDGWWLDVDEVAGFEWKMKNGVDDESCVPSFSNFFFNFFLIKEIHAWLFYLLLIQNLSTWRPTHLSEEPVDIDTTKIKVLEGCKRGKNLRG